MARSLHDIDERTKSGSETGRENRIGRAAASALAAAVSALIIATLVVNRSSDALDPDGTIAASSLSAGTVSLVDDDQGRSLFDLSDMAPGRPVVRCIELVYEGSIVPVDLALQAEAAGELSRFLDVSIDEGTGGSFETCDGFAATDAVFDGTLDELAGSGWLELARIVNTGTRTSYRIEFALQDEQAALGRAASASFVWEVTPS